MSLTLLLLAASGLSAPQSTDLFSRSLLEEYPGNALRDEKSAAAMVDLFVDPKGRIESCETISIIGDEALGRSICGVIKRKTLQAARDADGQPAYGAMRTVMSFTIPDTKMGDYIDQNLWEPALVLDVARMPSGLDDPYELTVTFSVSANGEIAQCEGEAGRDERFVKTACEQLKTQPIGAKKSRKDVAVPYVMEQKVQFTKNVPKVYDEALSEQ